MRGRKDMEEKAKTSTISEELREWQARLGESDAKWSKEVEKMNEREAVYNGDRTMQPLVLYILNSQYRLKFLQICSLNTP